MPSRFWKASGNGLLPSSNVFVVSAAWTPASLPGLNWWIEADPSKLYTDAGTTLVAADGDLVYQANDKSGLGHNFTQATSGNRPVYKTGSGKPYLQTNGTSQSLRSGTIAQTDGTGQHYMGVSVYLNSTTGSNAPVSMTDGTSTDVSRIDVFSGGTAAALSTGTGGVTQDNGGTVNAATPVVLIAVITSTTVEIFVDNVSAGSTSLPAQGAHVNAFACLGSYNDTLDFFGGRIYGAVEGTGTLSSTDRGNLQTYLAALHP